MTDTIDTKSILKNSEELNFNPANLKIITISRTTGSGASIVAQRLAEDMGWTVWDRNLLLSLAKDANIQKEIFRVIDEKHLDEASSYAYSLFGDTTLGGMVYTRQLARTIWAICAANKAIIIGRGANFIVPNALHVRIDAPFGVRTENMIKFENMTREEAEKSLKVADRDRRNFLVKAFGKDKVDTFPFDLQLNMNRLTKDDASQLIRLAFAQHEAKLKIKYADYLL
ncbi:MAG: cytidylate kinase-like family protein [Abditibacteriota bacterium]|nr:cytidylate kinase-like family protein [Abditibacteriota bacterium]